MTKEQFNHEMERIAALDWSITTTAATQAMFCMRYIESLEAENTNLKTEIAQLKKDKLEFNAQCFHKDETISILKNRISHLDSTARSLVEHVNAMALKPNQEIIEWHQHPLYPETSRCCIVECTDNCFYIAHHSDIDGWLNSATYEQLSNVKSWAYLPTGKNYTKAQEEES